MSPAVLIRPAPLQHSCSNCDARATRTEQEREKLARDTEIVGTDAIAGHQQPACAAFRPEQLAARELHRLEVWPDTLIPFSRECQ
jgi:hypothetical protein